MLQSLRSIPNLIYLFISVPYLVAAQDVFLSPQGSQFIHFSGSITGASSWTSNAVPPGDNEPSCVASGTITQGPFERTSLYVGINPPWDPNPFFFELYHYASDCDTDFCSTADTIFNLDFTSAAYTCIERSTGQPCGFVSYDYYYLPDVYINLKSKTTVQQLEIGGETGYTIQGGPDTWVGNDSANGVDAKDECNWLIPDGAVDGYTWIGFHWNDTTPINFTLSFTNTTASLTLTTTMLSNINKLPVSTLILSFTGSRNDTPIPYQGQIFDQYPIQLNTSDASTPHFDFINGSQIYFSNDSGTWDVAATPIPTSPRPTSTSSFGITGTGQTSRTASSASATSTTTAKPNIAIGWRRGVERTIGLSIIISFIIGLIL